MQILKRWAWRLTWLLSAWGAVTIPATLTQQPDARTDFAAYADYVTTTRFLAGRSSGGWESRCLWRKSSWRATTRTVLATARTSSTVIRSPR